MKDRFPIPFDPKHPRPTRIFNTGCCYGDKDYAAILAKTEEEMGWSDYKALFHIGGCTGSYQDLVYFLPRALEYLKRTPDDGIEFLSEVVFFISDEAEGLIRDGLMNPARQALRDCFEEWTSDFVVIHFDLEACRSKGWALEYCDIVARSEFVTDLLETVVFWNRHADLEEELARSLADQDDSELKSAWLLECAKETREESRFKSELAEKGLLAEMPEEMQSLLSKPMTSNGDDGIPFEPPTVAPSPTILELVNDTQLLQRHFDRIESSYRKSVASPTYWNDVQRILGLQ